MEIPARSAQPKQDFHRVKTPAQAVRAEGVQFLPGVGEGVGQGIRLFGGQEPGGFSCMAAASGGSWDLSERMTRERWNEQLPPRHTPAVRLSWSQDTRTSAEAQALLSVLEDYCIVMSNVLHRWLYLRNVE